MMATTPSAEPLSESISRVRVRMNGAGDMQYSLRRDLIPDTATLLQGYLTA